MKKSVSFLFFIFYCAKKILSFKGSRKRFELPVLAERIIPPGVLSETFKGFVTSPHNAQGLNLAIHKAVKGGVACEWRPLNAFQGYPDALHGGISFAILDELLAYAVFDVYETYAVTLSSRTQWFKKIAIGETITAHAYVVHRFWRFIRVEGVIFNKKGRVAIKMVGTFYMPTRQEFRRLVDLSTMPEEALPYCGTD